jgi:DNA polymerase III epsilon subunit-like protein
VFFDTETTGFDPADNQLTEIAAISAYPENWQFSEVKAEEGIFHDKIRLGQDTLDKFRDSEDIDKDKYALSLTRYGMPKDDYKDKYPKGMPTEPEVLEEFANYVNSVPNPVLVAQNAKFDVDFIQGRCKYHGIDLVLENYPIFDTMILIKLWHNSLIKTLAKQGDERAQKILQALTLTGKWGDYVTASMGPVSKAYEISTDDWHNALADVKMMMGMTRAIFMALQESSDTDISDQQGRVAWGLRKKRTGYHRSDK